MSLTIWCNALFDDAALRQLREATAAHRLVFSNEASASVLAAGSRDPALARADIALGQPAPEDCLRSKRLRWVALTTAGYARYDGEVFRETFRARGAALTNASSVFADPCAQHVLAMMLALGRQLLPSYREQLTERGWRYTERRAASQLLTGQTVLLLGYGAIARRLVELLRPFGCTVYAVRRQARSESGVRVIGVEDLTRVLPLADHVINVLPDNEATRDFVNARRLACCKAGARFYNVGRGATVDARALAEALRSGRLGAAYLDVFEPEPLPPEHELWELPNCYITPHTAGGRADQDAALVRLFIKNLAAFESGEAMEDRII